MNVVLEKHAYLVMAYDNFEQLIKLVHALDDERNMIFIHIDKKAKNFTSEIKSKILGEGVKCKIEIYSDIAVYWSHYSQVECELFLLEKAVEKGPFAYYHLLSGQCFPIKSQQYIHEFFDNNCGKEFIDYQNDFIEKNRDLIRKRIRYYHYFRKYCRFFKIKWMNFLFRGMDYICVKIQEAMKIDRCKKHGLNIAYGANWFSITDEFAKYVLSKKSWIERNFKYSNCADELFMQTILKSSPFQCNLYRETRDDFYGNMRLVDLKRGNPYIYRSKDISEIENSKYLFVRKVDERVDKNIIELIEDFIKKQSTGQ